MAPDRWRLLYSIILPLARPGMVAVFLVAHAVTTWNNFLIPLIFTRTDDSQPLTIVLTLFIGQYEVAWEDMSAAAVVTMLPPFLMALFFQRYLVRGLDHGRGEVRIVTILEGHQTIFAFQTHWGQPAGKSFWFGFPQPGRIWIACRLDRFAAHHDRSTSSPDTAARYVCVPIGA